MIEHHYRYIKLNQIIFNNGSIMWLKDKLASTLKRKFGNTLLLLSCSS